MLADKLGSRKLWVTLIVGAITVFAQSLGLSEDTVAELVNLATFYLVGQGAVDAAGHFRANSL